MYSYCNCPVTLPHGAVAWFTVCKCGISYYTHLLFNKIILCFSHEICFHWMNCQYTVHIESFNKFSWYTFYEYYLVLRAECKLLA